MSALITLLTDFGWRDGYVAAMKGMIWTVAPDARIVDAAHNVPPQDVRAAGWVLHQYWKTYPPGTIHVAVVDPGVGMSRAPLLLRADGYWLVGPDNGLFSWVAEWSSGVEAWTIRPEIHAPAGLSNTFHGRDLYGYVAGLLAAGMTPDQLAVHASSFHRAPWIRAVQRSPRRVEGEVIHIDHFGNCITNIAADDWDRIEGRTRMLEVRSYFFNRLHRTYGEVEPGRKLILVGSSGYIEIAVREEHAADRMHLHAGELVTLTGVE